MIQLCSKQTLSPLDLETFDFMCLCTVQGPVGLPGPKGDKGMVGPPGRRVSVIDQRGTVCYIA